MKKLYTLSPFFSPSYLLIYTRVFFLSLYMLISCAKFNFFADIGIRWKSVFLNATTFIEEIGMHSSFTNSESANTSFADANFAFASTAEIQWSQITTTVRIDKEAQAAVVNHKMYIFGGFDHLKSCCTPTNRAYVFDPKANSYTRIKNMPAMNGTGYGGVTHAGFTTDGTDIYFAGGYTSNHSGTGQIFGTKEAWKYDISENNYSRLPELPIPLSAGELEYLNGKLHWIGGTNLARTQDLGIHYVLDLSKLQEGWRSLAPLPNPRNHFGSAVYNSKIYIFGGQHGHDAKLITQNDVHVYDPATNQWKQLADMPKAISHHTGATFTLGDRIFIIGGRTSDASTSTLRDVIAYNPKSNNWTRFTDLPAKRSSGVAGVMNGIIYYSLGQNIDKGILLTKPTVNIWLEAECSGAIGAKWTQVSDASASAGAYLKVKNGYNSLSTAPGTAADKVSYTVSVPSTGSYHISARVKAPTHSDNSFWIRVDGGAWMLWNIALTGSSFAWRTVQNSPFSLTAGSHTIDIAYREDGTLLDKVYISTSSSLPTGTGGTAANCGSTASIAKSTAAEEPDLQQAVADAVEVYPNPGDGLFEVQLNRSRKGKGSVIVRNLQGVIIKDLAFEEALPERVLLDLNHQPVGIYILQIESEQRTVIKRLIKER